LKKLYSLLVAFLMVNCTIYFQFNPSYAISSISSPFNAARIHPGFNFAVVGDMGCSSMAQKVINHINNKTPKLILALGDLSYQRSNADCWLNIVSPIESKMKIVLGDHDYESDFLLKQYKSHFNLSQEYYSFNYENVHFIALATEIPFDMKSSQYNFIKNDLEAVSKNSEIKWIIVFSYRPQYSSPTKHPGNADIRAIYHPLFEKYQVDIVLQAHNHNYQRTYPVNYNQVESSSPIVTDNNPKTYEDPVAPLYITVGTGGATLHKFKGKESYVAAQYLGFGFLDISITNNSRNLTGTFYDSSDGAVEDHFTVIK
jgi:predicted MPP superfamily phosphohydrolase